MIHLIPIIFGAASLAYNLGKDYLTSKRDKESQDLAQSNLDLNKTVANQNYDLAKQQFEYQKQLNETVMQREDTAYQRQVADLQAAGLSPLMVSGGSSATPLTSANAPQLDLSGVNTAMGNMLSAYNDIFNRRMTRQQFRLNAALQTADAYNKITEAKLERRYLGLQSDYLDAELKYNKVHGFRDLDWKSELLYAAEKLLNINTSSVLPTLGNVYNGSIPLGNSNYLQQWKNNMSNLLKSENNSNTLPLGNIQNFNLPSNKEKGLSEWKYDPDWYPGVPKRIEKQLNQAFNYVQTRNGKNDKKRIEGINYLWENTNASEFFRNKSDFENKILNDSYYQKHLKDFIRFYIYPNGYFDNK